MTGPSGATHRRVANGCCAERIVVRCSNSRPDSPPPLPPPSSPPIAPLRSAAPARPLLFSPYSGSGPFSPTHPRTRLARQLCSEAPLRAGGASAHKRRDRKVRCPAAPATRRSASSSRPPPFARTADFAGASCSPVLSELPFPLAQIDRLCSTRQPPPSWGWCTKTPQHTPSSHSADLLTPAPFWPALAHAARFPAAQGPARLVCLNTRPPGRPSSVGWTLSDVSRPAAPSSDCARTPRTTRFFEAFLVLWLPTARRGH